MADKVPSLLPLNNSNRFDVPIYETGSTLPSPLSPTRHGRFATEELDPLLSNLSPVSTLEALRATEAVVYLPGSKEKVLADSIAEASETERALGIRAALAGKKIREWVDELQAWKWPDGKFEPPRELAVTDDAGNRSAQVILEKSTEVYWGSLPAKLVQELEGRIDNIRDDIDTLEVEDLKNYVRGAHSQATSRSSSFSYHDTFTFQATQYNRMADFTVIITATIVQTLPLLARLGKILNLWSLRCTVLRLVPGFLRQLEDVQVALDSAWSTTSQASGTDAFGLSRDTYLAIKNVLEDRVSELARQIDSILDVLEGHEDRIPDKWIDDMEDSQRDFENWVVEAENLVRLHEWPSRETVAQQDQDEREVAKESGDHETANDTSIISNGHDNKLLHVSHNGDHSEAAVSLTSQDIKPTNIIAPMTPTKELGDGTARKTSEGQTGAEIIQSDQSVENGKVISPSRGLFFMRNTPPRTIPTSPTSSNKSPPSDRWQEATADLSLLSNEEEGENAFQKALDEQSISIPVAQAKEPLAYSVEDGINDGSILRRTSSRKPAPLQLAAEKALVEPALSSEASYGTSASSGAFSDMSSPQIMDAASVQFFKSPVEDKFPVYVTRDAEDLIPRQTGQRTQTPGRSGHGRSVSAYEPISRSRAGSHLSDMTVIGREAEAESKDEQDEYVLPAIAALKRASIASFESVPRSELRNIDIKRHSSFIPEDRELLNDASEKSVAEQISEVQKELEAERPGSPPGGDSSPSLRVRKARLSSVGDFSELERGGEEPPQALENSLQEQKPLQDKMTAKISRILTKIPAPIQFAVTPPHAESTEAGGKAGAAKHLETPANRVQRLSTPSLTLSPAVKTRGSSAQHGSSEVRVYHLHEAGKDQPIKLFIRLVGTEERVMVRVGGGWADLAEYLKEYAIHHGHRSVSSSNKLEIKGLPSQSASNTQTLSHEVGRSPSNSISAGTPASNSSTPQARRESLIGKNSSPYTPESTNMETDASPPSSNTHDSSSLGLAGPKSKKELSPTKKAWVDGMINQARHISFEKKKGGESVEGGSETRKVSGIRRVFMRGKTEEN